jgi:Uncharacterised nucleotidyltransferase
MDTIRDRDLLGTLKRAASVLKARDIPFALAGGFAVYARGGTTSDHDVDFLIREQDAVPVLEALGEAGFTTATPPEDWLVKAYDEDRLVDLIHRPVERPVTAETLRDTDLLTVEAIALPVISASTLLVHKALTFGEHYCDFATALPLARSLREQIDWARVRAEVDASPYARALLHLLAELDVMPADGARPRERTVGHD